MSRLLFISSDNTGHGHRSIALALTEQLGLLDPLLEVDEVDGFMLGGRFYAAMSRLYDKIAVRAPLFWKFYYSLGNVFPSVAAFFTAASIKSRLCRLLSRNPPDLIVSLHPCFVGSVENVLEEKGLKIPVISLIADLDNVSRLWADRRSLFTLCPTENARQSMLKFGIMDEKIKVTGFPVRNRFCVYDPDTARYKSIGKEGKINFLIMNGSQGLGRSAKMAEELLDNFNCSVTILAGNNKKAKEALEKSLERYKGRVAVYGFVEDVEKYMREADILLLRASPNVMMEAVALCRPFIITGSLTGQEEKNPDFAANNRVGAVCKDVDRLSGTVSELLASNGEKLNEIIDNQIRYRNPAAARNTARFILSAICGISGGVRNENN